MIHKVKTVTWEVRSHRYKSEVDNEGRLNWEDLSGIAHGNNQYHHPERKSDIGALKRVIWHLQDVLKVLNKLEKEKEQNDQSN